MSMTALTYWVSLESNDNHIKVFPSTPNHLYVMHLHIWLVLSPILWSDAQYNYHVYVIRHLLL